MQFADGLGQVGLDADVICAGVDGASEAVALNELFLPTRGVAQGSCGDAVNLSE